MASCPCGAIRLWAGDVKIRWRKVGTDVNPEARGKAKAIALFSGGLDSTLAAAVVKRLGVEVIGLHVQILFDSSERRSHALASAAAQVGIPLRTLDRCEEQLEVVRHPQHGRGSGMNPCIDCRIFMLHAAREAMEEEGAQFVVTGEVLGQRPMSQNLQSLLVEAEESGLGERLVRPLSAALLPETLPVKEGWIRRDGLLALRGRGRDAQIELARALGIEDYPQPAGGCLLTEKVYSARLRDAFAHGDRDLMRKEEFLLLRYGRQFRLSDRAKLIVGRNEGENAILDRYSLGRIRLEPAETVGPVALVEGDPAADELRLAASLVARYCDRGGKGPIALTLLSAGTQTLLSVAPLSSDDPRIAAWRIGEASG